VPGAPHSGGAVPPVGVCPAPGGLGGAGRSPAAPRGWRGVVCLKVGAAMCDAGVGAAVEAGFGGALIVIHSGSLERSTCSRAARAQRGPDRDPPGSLGGLDPLTQPNRWVWIPTSGSSGLAGCPRTWSGRCAPAQACQLPQASLWTSAKTPNSRQLYPSPIWWRRTDQTSPTLPRRHASDPLARAPLSRARRFSDPLGSSGRRRARHITACNYLQMQERFCGTCGVKWITIPPHNGGRGFVIWSRPPDRCRAATVDGPTR